MKPHYFHPDAAKEYAAAEDYSFKIQRELGRRFYEEIERLIETGCRQPDLFRVFDAAARRHFSTIFPYCRLPAALGVTLNQGMQKVE